MMKRIFQEEIEETLEVCLDDMIINSRQKELQRVFKRVKQFKMCLNPEKCTFWVREGKFLGFYFTE